MNSRTKMRQGPRIPRWLTAALGAVILWASMITGLFSQAPPALDPRLPKDLGEAIVAATPFFEANDALIDNVLQRAGYNHPGIANDIWNTLAPIFKLETAYLSAEQAQPGSGQQMMYLVSRQLAQMYDNAERDPVLAPIMRQPEPAAALRFAELPLAQVNNRRNNIPAAMRDAIMQMSNYFEGGSHGLIFFLNAYYRPAGIELGSDAHQIRVRELLRSHATIRETLINAFVDMAAADRDVAMGGAVSYLDANYEQAVRERRFDPWRRRGERALTPPITPPWSPPGGARPWRASDGPMPSGGIVPPPPVSPNLGPKELAKLWQQDKVRSYADFIRKEYRAENPILKIPPLSLPPVKFPTFKRAVKTPRGFGGVIFGNSVRSDNVPNVRKLRWEPDAKDPGRGILLFETGAGAETLRLEGLGAKHLSADLVRAGYEIFFSRPAKDSEAAALPPANADDAIGLVGLQYYVPYFECGPEKLTNLGRRWTFLLHPALANTDLGWSTLLCDLQCLDELRPNLGKRIAVVSEEHARAFHAIFDPKRNPFTTYKFVDVPTRITRDKGVLVVERDPAGAPAVPAETLRQVFLSLHLYLERSGKESVWDADKEFYPIAPSLFKASQDYDRLNDLARVLAALRWAKSIGADFSEPPAVPVFRPRAGSVIVSQAGVTVAPDFDVQSHSAELSKRVRLRMGLLGLQGKEPLEEFSHAYEKAFAEVEKRLPMEFSESFSKKRKETEEEYFARMIDLTKKLKATRLDQSRLSPKQLQYWQDLRTYLVKYYANRVKDPLPRGERILDRNGALDKIKVQDTHTVFLKGGQLYVVDLISDDFDAFLRLEDSTGKILDSDDDSGVGLDARLWFRAPRDGEYRLVATSYKEHGAGRYRLEVYEITPPSK